MCHGLGHSFARGCFMGVPEELAVKLQYGNHQPQRVGDRIASAFKIEQARRRIADDDFPTTVYLEEVMDKLTSHDSRLEQDLARRCAPHLRFVDKVEQETCPDCSSLIFRISGVRTCGCCGYVEETM